MKSSVVVVIILGVVLFAGAVASWFFVRATESDANGGYWADASKVSVTPAGYVTNAAGEVSAILAITNAGPYTFWYSGHVDTFDGRHWVNYPAGDIYVYTPCDSLLTPFSSASMIISVPSSQIRWRADLQLRDVHGTNSVAHLTCLWEKFVKKNYKSANVYTQE
jgi:hypothetical protein